MRRNLSTIFILIIFLSFLIGCRSAYEINRSEYDTLGSAVAASSYAVIGEYGENIPSDLSNKFINVIEKNIPENYFNEIKKYTVEIKPKGSYYLLLILLPETKDIILFDYSCTPEPDGLVLLETNKYDLKNIDLYDPCKINH